jgi:hypothetical protein
MRPESPFTPPLRRGEQVYHPVDLAHPIVETESIERHGLALRFCKCPEAMTPRLRHGPNQHSPGSGAGAELFYRLVLAMANAVVRAVRPDSQ